MRILAATLLVALCAAPAAARPGGFVGVWIDPAGPEARVGDVAPASPAAKAGLRRGDLLVAVQGRPVESAAALAARLARVDPGLPLRLAVVRGGDRLEVTLGPRTWGAYRRARPAPAPAPAGQAIVVAGREVPIGAPVITWRHPQGFDGYEERCAFSDDLLPTRPAAGCDTPRRYGARRDLSPALAAVVAAPGGFTPDLAALQIDQVVVHYDVAWTSRNCFKVLHDLRGLSCHFLLDVDGTLYQTLDVVERARHAGSANDRSIGIEIAHPGPLELTEGLAARYRVTPQGPAFDLGRLANDPRTPGFVVRPARPQPVRGEVQGRAYSQYDFTVDQYETLSRLLAGLHRVLPRLRLEVPRDAEGRVRSAVLAAEEQAAFSGVLGHYHVSGRKQDPGPAFDWERVLTGARARAAAPAGDERPRRSGD